MLPDWGGGGVTTKVMMHAKNGSPEKNANLNSRRGRAAAARKHHVERTLDLRQLAVESELLVESSPQAGEECVNQRGQAERRCVDVCAGGFEERPS